MSELRFTSLEQALAAAGRLRGAGVVTLAQGTWSPARALHHCAASLECSVRGYPRRSPWPVRAIARAFVLPKILRAGVLHHDCEEPVPGLDEGDPDPALGPALDRLEAAARAFLAAPRHAPHAVFGAVAPEPFARFHALHLADHLARFVVDGRPFAEP